MISLLKSRKFWLTICGVLLPVIDKKFGLDIPPEALVSAIMAIVVLVGSIAYEDVGKAKAEEKPSDKKEAIGFNK